MEKMKVMEVFGWVLVMQAKIEADKLNQQNGKVN